VSKLRGIARKEFPLKVRKLAFARCCKQCNVDGIENIPGVPQCENCGNVLRAGNIEYEHLDADGLGGEPTLENCGVWCAVPCSSKKTHTQDNPRMQKADRVLKKNFGLTPAKRKIQSAGFRRAAPQRTASRPIERRS
jgi:5-methylcytosine-specific restriction protein A